MLACIAFPVLAEATGIQTVRVAQAARKQYGTAGECDVVSALAHQSKSGKHGIQAAHSVFRKTGLALKVKVTELPGACNNMHVVFLTDFVDYMVKTCQLHRLLGGLSMDEIETVLRNFWDCFRKIHPDHEVFEAIDSGQVDPGCLIPFMMHGDEGRGAPLLVAPLECYGFPIPRLLGRLSRCPFQIFAPRVEGPRDWPLLLGGRPGLL
jgi:hypothetical protein